MIRLMNNFKNKRLIFTLFSQFLLIAFTQGQVNEKFLDTPDKLIDFVDQVYGLDDMLVNGRIYVPMHSLAEGHPYFEVKNWILGDIYIKGNKYEQSQLKYDIELDEFILYIKDKQNRKNYIVLNHHYVDSIYLGKYFFVNTAVVSKIGPNIGYVEMVYNDDLMFIVKYKKDFKKQYSESKPHGEYTKTITSRYVVESGELIKLNTKKAFLNYFESSKKEIKRYMKKNKINYKKANSGELNTLIKYCNEIR